MSNDREDKTLVFLRLKRAEAIVLFEWLVRVTRNGGLPCEDPAEEQVLWQLEGQLQTKLVEPLQPNYGDVVEAARKEVRGSAE